MSIPLYHTVTTPSVQLLVTIKIIAHGFTQALLPKINEEDRTPLVDVLLEVLAWQEKQIDRLEQEILKLKSEPPKPKIKPSKMDDDKADNSDTTKKNRLLLDSGEFTETR